MSKILSDILGETMTREEALDQIYQSPTTKALFQTLPRQSQEDIIAFIEGRQSIPMLFDPFFNYVMSGPDNIPFVTKFISDILSEELSITSTLPNIQNVVDKINYYSMNFEATMDTGRKADVEFHKMSVAPSNKMVECLAANNIMKQYNRLKERKGLYFRFDLLRPSYIIIFTEKSRASKNKYFIPHSDKDYIQTECNFIDSANRIQGLTNIIIISLEDYARCHQVRKSGLDAWMTFMQSYSANDVLQLATVFPHFEAIYKKVSHLRYDTPKLIDMYIEGQKLRYLNATIMSTVRSNQETLALRNATCELREENREKSKEIARLNKTIRNLKKKISNK